MVGSPYPCIWFDGVAEEAVAFYLSVFKDGKRLAVDHYTNVGEAITGRKEGEVVTIEFEVLGRKFLALNAGPEFACTPAISFVLECDTQDEIDYYWGALSSDKDFEQCGWLRDRYGVSWQVVPRILGEMLLKGTAEQRRRVTSEYMEMKKFDIGKIRAAFGE